VQRGVLLVLVDLANGHSWQHVEMVNAGGGKWVGTMTVPSGTSSIGNYFVQLADTAGNVGIDSNKARDFFAGAMAGFGFSASPPPDPNTGLYQDGTTVSITPPPGQSFTYSLDGGPQTSYSGPITITGDKGHTLTATAANGSTASLGIPIDAHPPSVTITTPANGSNYFRGQVVASSFSCSSAVSIRSCSGPATVDTSSPGSKTFTVTATDYFGRTSTASTTYNVVDQPPAVVLTTKPPNPTHPADSANYGKFVYSVSDPDDPASSLTVACKLDGATVPCGPDLANVTPASQTAAHTFVVTVTDPFGATGSASYSWNVYLDTVVTAAGVVGSVPHIDADLKTAGGAPIAGKTVYFFAGQNKNPTSSTGNLCSAVTDSSGHARCNGTQYTLTAVGQGGITVVFFGTTDYWKSPPSSAGVIG
jgi:hypothetical protein